MASPICIRGFLADIKTNRNGKRSCRASRLLSCLGIPRQSKSKLSPAVRSPFLSHFQAAPARSIHHPFLNQYLQVLQSSRRAIHLTSLSSSNNNNNYHHQHRHSSRAIKSRLSRKASHLLHVSEQLRTFMTTLVTAQAPKLPNYRLLNLEYPCLLLAARQVTSSSRKTAPHP